MENRSNLAVAATVTHADGQGLAQGFFEDGQKDRPQKQTPHVAQNFNRKAPRRLTTEPRGTWATACRKPAAR
jgi:hypothetical protein